MKKIIICGIIFCLVIVGIFIFNEKNSNNMRKISVAEVTHSVFYTPQYVALEKGFFKEEGLDISITLTSGVVKK